MAMKKEKRSRGEEEDDTVEGGGATSNDEEVVSTKSKKSKKSKSSKKKNRLPEDDTAAAEDNDTADDTTSKATSGKEESRVAKKAAKKTLKEQLQSKIPKVDSDGIPYNKIQIRRMMRRVKHGLAPIPTQEEENEIRARAKRERVEEDLLYAEQTNDAEEEDREVNGEIENEQIEDVNEDNNEATATESEQQQQQEAPKKEYHNPPSKKTKRSKPVPPDYICMACKNKPPSSVDGIDSLTLFTPHWIYDCPLKNTKKGCNKVAKKLRGLHDPPSRKVFVSGLPFECDEASVKRFFDDGMSNEEGGFELVHCKLLKFEDSKRCKGNGFLTFDSDDAAKLAIKCMNSKVWKDIEEPGISSKKGKKGKDVKVTEKKDLKIKVVPVLNRFVTKNKKWEGGNKGMKYKVESS